MKISSMALLLTLSLSACTDHPKETKSTTSPPTPPVTEQIEHLRLAEQLITHIDPADNSYASKPHYIRWPGVDGASTYANRTLCNHFLKHLLQRAYGFDDAYFTAWSGETTPEAEDYHDLIQTQNNFSLITHINDIQAGDIIAIKYPETETNTGHVMIAVAAPVPHAESAPLQAGMRQYTIKVADSSHSGHGPNDSRKHGDIANSGAGIGELRLYTDATGSISGYTWSLYKNSVFYSQEQRHLLVGRLQSLP